MMPVPAATPDSPVATVTVCVPAAALTWVVAVVPVIDVPVARIRSGAVSGCAASVATVRLMAAGAIATPEVVVERTPPTSRLATPRRLN